MPYIRSEAVVVKRKSGSGETRTRINYDTPTDDDPELKNDSDALVENGIGKHKGEKVFPVRIHVTQVRPDKMQKTDGRVELLPNEQVTEQTRKACGIEKQWEVSEHANHSAFYVGHELGACLKFHYRKWEKCFTWTVGDKIYIYLFFHTSPYYKHFYQVRITDGGTISPDCALMGKFAGSAPPCACLEGTLGNDKLTLTDTKFKFIRINGDMENEVDLELDDERLIVSPREIRMKVE